MTAYCGLVRFDLPGPVVVLLSEGADVKWGSDLFVPADATFGAIGAVEALAEGVGSEVPALQIELKIPTSAAAATMLAPGAQKSRVQAWMAAVDLNTSTVTGTPVRLFNGFLDQSRLIRAAGSLALTISVVSLLEQLFELNIGNSLSPAFHKSVWPGETGEDHATGLTLADAWGVEAPPAAISPGYGGGGGGGFTGPGWRGGKVVNA